LQKNNRRDITIGSVDVFHGIQRKIPGFSAENRRQNKLKFVIRLFKITAGKFHETGSNF
jgi:hypothetical protein